MRGALRSSCYTSRASVDAIPMEKDEQICPIAAGLNIKYELED